MLSAHPHSFWPSLVAPTESSPVFRLEFFSPFTYLSALRGQVLRDRQLKNPLQASAAEVLATAVAVDDSETDT